MTKEKLEGIIGKYRKDKPTEFGALIEHLKTTGVKDGEKITDDDKDTA
jgi:hypothetical protein